MDRAIIKAVTPQFIEIGRRHGSRRLCQLDGVGAKCAVRRSKRCLTPVRRDQMDKAVSFRFIRNPKIGDLSPEVVGMGAASIETVIFRRDHHRQHLALSTAQG